MKRTYNFTPDQVARLEGLAGRLGTDKTDVLTNGLRLVFTAVRAVSGGGQIAVVDAAGNVSPLLGPWSDLEPAGGVA